MKEHSKRFLLIHGQDDFQSLSNSESVDSHTCLCLSPMALYLAEKSGREYVDIESYLPSTEEEVALGFENKRRAAAIIDYLAHRYQPILGDCADDIFESFFFTLSIQMDHYLCRFLTMERFLKDVKPTSLTVPVWENKSSSNCGAWQRFLEYDQPLLLDAARFFKPQHGYDFREVFVPATNEKATTHSLSIARALARNLQTWSIDFLSSFLSSILITYGGGETEFVAKMLPGLRLKFDYNVDTRSVSFFPSSWKNSPEMKKYLKACAALNSSRMLWQNLINDKQFSTLWCFGEVDLLKIYSQRLKLLLEELIPDILYVYFISVHLLRTKKVSYVLSGTPTYPYNTIVLLAGRKLGKRRVVCQHGGSYGYFSNGLVEMFFKEIRYGDYFLTWGCGITEYAKSHHRGLGNPSCRVVPAGSLELGALKRKLDARQTGTPEKIVYYVPTNFVGDYRRLLYHCYPDGWYYRFQRKLVRLLLKYTAIPVVYKAHYKGKYKHQDPIVSMIKDFGNTNITISYEPLGQVLHMAGAFIIDCPTTSFIQALLSRKPVWCFVNTRLSPIDNRAMQVMKESSNLYEDEDEFLSCLDKAFSDQSIFLQTKQNESFLNLYGNSVHDYDHIVKSLEWHEAS